MANQRPFARLLGLWVAVSSLVLATGLATARDVTVDPETGDDATAATTGIYKTIPRAIRFAEAGDTIHLKPVVYRDYAGFYGKHGAPDRPITLDGHGATLEGADELDPAAWEEVSPGLFKNENLLRLDDAMIGRWFFVINGRMNLMHRTSKGPSAPLKSPDELQPGEWTFVKDDTRQVAGSMQIFGAFYIRLEPGMTLAAAHILAPVRSAGVQFGGDNSHLVIKDLTATHPYNDGFNIHGKCRNVRFENIQAIDCGDDGISAHDDSQYTVKGFVSMGNSTGICDTGASITSYEDVYIKDCLGFDLFFLDTGTYSVKNAVVISTSARTLQVVGRKPPEAPCRLALENVYLHRSGSENEFRVSENCALAAHRVTLENLHLQATGGDVTWNHSAILGNVQGDRPPPNPKAHVIGKTGEKPRLLLWKGVNWTGTHNLYDLRNIRVDRTDYLPEQFDMFQKLVDSETDSACRSFTLDEAQAAGVGADVAGLKRALTPPER